MITRAVLVATILAWSAHAFADAKADAKKHVEKATEAHAQGKYDVALSELTLAYSLDPQPQLLYAIGQVHVKLGHCAEAIDFYQRFLASKPPPQAADEAQQAIDTCKKQPEQAPQPPPAPPEPPPPAPPQQAPPPAAPGPTAFYGDAIADALAGAGAVAIVIGALEYKSALSDLDSADHAATYDAQQKLVDDAHGKRTTAIVFGVAGVALVGAGVYRFVTHDREEAHGVAVVPTREGGLVTWSGRF
ncbi:MAG: tetratricopeptide repeat protein [Acidobacteriota bacterium]